MKTHLFLVASLFTVVACVTDDTTDPSADPTATGGKSDDATDLHPRLPVLGSARVVFEPAPDLAAVQPTASLHFTYASCSKRTWTVKTQITPTLEGDRTLVQLEDQHADCFGPTIVREYAVQVTSDAVAERNFVLINPTAMTFAN